MNHLGCEWLKRDYEGSCNSCQDHEDPLVLVVTCPTLTFRLCRKCAASLRDTLDVYL